MDKEIKMNELRQSLEGSTGKERRIFFFDTETSGFINKKLSSIDPQQAWCIQLGGLLTNTLGEEIDRLNYMIKPEGRSMHPKALETHGIELHVAQEQGLPELEVTNLFGSMLRQADLIVCHNYAFDWAHVIAMWERNLNELSDEARSAFYLDIPYICTMKNKKIVNFCGLKNKIGKPKWPKLIELHQKLFDCTFEGQHDAMADILATKKCFFALLEQGVLNLIEYLIKTYTNKDDTVLDN